MDGKSQQDISFPNPKSNRYFYEVNQYFPKVHGHE